MQTLSIHIYDYYSYSDIRYGSYKDGLKTGIWCSRRDSCLLHVTFVNDTIIGPVTRYYPDGKIDLQGEINRGEDKVKLKHYDLSGNFREVYEYRIKDIWDL